MPSGSTVRAWRPDVPGISEVLHARFTQHTYPLHTHDTWTLLLVDDGVVRYDLDRREHAALTTRVTLLPPGVPHDGQGLEGRGFRKRVIYLDAGTLGQERIGRSVDHPDWLDPQLRRQVDHLHHSLGRSADVAAAEEHLALVLAHLADRLERRDPVDRPDPVLARRLRGLLDDRVVTGLPLAEAGRILDAHPSHLVRAFRHSTGITPHRYLTGRRLDLARHLLLAGARPAAVASEVGFHDQAHLTRHFARLLGVTPSEFARSAR